MQVKIHELLNSIHHLNGSIIVIDVFRAFSTALYVMANGAEQMMSVSSLDRAYELSKEFPDAILMGERDGYIQPGFSYGNSPKAIEQIDFTAKHVIHTSSSGTQGLVLASQYSQDVLTGSFVNAKAVCRYIQNQSPDEVHIVAMGLGGIQRAEEDWVCAHYIHDMLTKQEVCFDTYFQRVKQAYRSLENEYVKSGRWMPGDMELCLKANHFSFVLKSTVYDKECVVLKKEEIQDILFV